MKTKKIVAYTHPSPAPAQAPDPQPGHYYVSARDGERVWWLLGPFPKHAQALAMVEPVRAMGTRGNPRAVFYAFGTLRAETGEVPGSANKYFPEAFAPVLEAAA